MSKLPSTGSSILLSFHHVSLIRRVILNSVRNESEFLFIKDGIDSSHVTAFTIIGVGVNQTVRFN